MIRRPPRSTQSRSSAASDVYKRQALRRALAMSTLFGAALGIVAGILAGAALHPARRSTRWLCALLPRSEPVVQRGIRAEASLGVVPADQWGAVDSGHGHVRQRAVRPAESSISTYDSERNVILAGQRRARVPPPTNILTMTLKIFLQVRPQVHEHLQHWIDQARKIPSPKLQEKPLESIAAKTFHCEGGGIYSLLAGDRYREAIRFIVAYQTISDYLDNLCDRGTSLDPDDF